MTDLGLVHVVYAPFGSEPLRQFLNSYRRHPAGIDHRLILVCKAFEADALPDEYLALLAGIAHQPLFTPDGGFDLGSYLLAARACEHGRLCFLNSSSVILADGWLAKLATALDTPGVGLVGATGSHESFFTNLHRTIRPADCPNPLRRFVRNGRSLRVLLRARLSFHGFPNAHLRTNAFLVERQHLLAMRAGPFRTKEDCLKFENGRRSLTRQIQARGLEVRVVGRDGRAYPPEQWAASDTFRHGEQENLLVADNRTRDYQEADEPTRRLLAQMAWGG